MGGRVGIGGGEWVIGGWGMGRREGRSKDGGGAAGGS